MSREVTNYISRLSKRTKLGAVGVIISILSVFIIEFSFIAFCVCYLFGVFLVLISAFIRTKKLQKNTLGEIISRIGLVLIMLGVFGPLGFSKNFYYLTLLGIFVVLNKKSNTEEKKDC